MTARPRRSCLYMPGANAKALEKAKTLPADVLLLDLEDSVAPEAQDAARDQVAAAVKAGGYGKREVIVRVNGLATPWGRNDIVAAGIARPALKALREGGRDGLTRFLDDVERELRAVMLLTGSRTVADLQRTPRFLTGELVEWERLARR